MAFLRATFEMTTIMPLMVRKNGTSPKEKIISIKKSLKKTSQNNKLNVYQALVHGWDQWE